MFLGLCRALEDKPDLLCAWSSHAVYLCIPTGHLAAVPVRVMWSGGGSALRPQALGKAGLPSNTGPGHGPWQQVILASLFWPIWLGSASVLSGLLLCWSHSSAPSTAVAKVQLAFPARPLGAAKCFLPEDKLPGSGLDSPCHIMTQQSPYGTLHC